MAFPSSATSPAFEQDQTIAFQAHYWDTTATALRLGPAFGAGEVNTAFGSGLSFGLFNLLDPAFAPTSADDIEAALAPGSGVTESVLGYNAQGEYRMGVVPNIYQYWGAGAPPGAGRARQVLLKYSGFVRQYTPAATMCFAGSGRVLAVVTRSVGGARVTICQGQLKPPAVVVSLVGVNANTIQEDWGYVFNTTPMTFNIGDRVDIYYWHNGEPWGGIAGKIRPGAMTTTSDAFLRELREAAVIGTSFMGAEPDVLPPMPIPYIVDVNLKRAAQAIPEMTISVALTTPGESGGYYLDQTDGAYALVDNADDEIRIQRGRLVHFEGGFELPNRQLELYPRFTGYIWDILPSDDGDTAQLICRGIEHRLAETTDENCPDRLSYLANGYILRQRTSEPVYPIPAYDFWPLEVAIADLCYKAGIDSWSLGISPVSATTNQGRRRFRDAYSGNITFGTRLFSARLLADNTQAVRLEGNANYGNVGPLSRDDVPPDETYLFAPNVQQRLYDRASGLAEHYGYDFGFNEEGVAFLAARNNPVYFQYMTRPGPYCPSATNSGEVVRVSAVGGVAFRRLSSSGSWSRVIEGEFSRLDLYVGVGIEESTGLNGGRLLVTTEASDGLGGWILVGTSTYSTYVAGDEAFAYDDYARRDGTNAAIIRILQAPFARYRVTIAPAGPEAGQSSCVYRLNGVAVFERDPEQSALYDAQREVKRLTTLDHVLSMSPESNFGDMLNQVIVVGGRKATVTDSEKLTETGGPNNPEHEFHVAVAVDPFSIYDPTSTNFAGMRRMAVVFDERVSDSEMARWLTRTVLTRYRQPKTSVKCPVSILPMLEVRDALYLTDERHKIVDHLLWVTSFSESWSLDEATTQLEAVAHPEIASYQPREDVDIDTYFDADGDGKGVPVINVRVEYANLYGRPVTNASLSSPSAIRSFAAKAPGVYAPMASVLVTDGTSMQLPHTAVPASMYLGWNISSTLSGVSKPTDFVDGGYQVTPKRVLVNNPYRHFYRISGWDVNKRPTVQFTFQEGDGTPGVYDKAAYGFPTGAGGSWYVNYDYLQARTGENPFYDPYSSQVGNLVSIKFDALVSGRYRISLWDANRGEGFETPVAWLTAPSADPTVPDLHWVSIEPGANKEFLWDGVDNIGFWNTLQTLELGEELRGSFGDKPTVIGRGFYAANDKATNLHTFVGDTHAANFDKDNAPYFTIGRYGQFLVRIEVLNDGLMRKDLARFNKAEPRVVDSSALDQPGNWNPTSEVYVWTHLGEPTQVAMRIQDWVGAGSWVPGQPTNPSDWSAYSTPDPEASIRDGKPVRITFQMQPRRSPFFEDAAGNPDVSQLSVQLTRQVHLKTTVFDQYWHLTGKTWQGFKAKYPVGATEQKRLNNRLYHNDEHTLEYEDAAWRSGSALALTEWIFDPSQFEKDFGLGIKERLRYGDFEQLEALPGFDARRLGGPSTGERSYLTMAYMSYLFYFSAFAFDRSGRRQWCINSWLDGSGNRRGFIDRTKIVSPTWRGASDNPASGSYTPYAILSYPRDAADRYLVRSVFVRQWKEPGWVTGSYAGNPVTRFGISGAQLAYVQVAVENFDVRKSHFTAGNPDPWLAKYQTAGSFVAQNVQFRSKRHSGATSPPVLAGAIGGRSLTGLGSWNFERPTVTGFCAPDPGRDFQPFWRYPYMPDASLKRTDSYLTSQEPGAVDVLSGASSNRHFALRDLAAKEEWYGYAFSDAWTAANSGEYGARLEITAEELGASEVGELTQGPQLEALYDYRRSDQLDRWDQFRGVISRAPYGNRKDVDSDVSYRAADKKRATGTQPVRPAGVYLFNLGRYADYILAGVHGQMALDPKMHFTSAVTDWFALRFHHEYAWYSSRWFPVTREGGAVYGYTMDEFTRASRWFGVPWWAIRSAVPGVPDLGIPDIFTQLVFDSQNLYFDSGAWTGWKPDVSGATWSSDPRLRWAEIRALFRPGGALAQVSNAGGGAGEAAPGPVQYTRDWLNATPPSDYATYARVNIFDDYETSTQYMRLAVGPEPDESRGLVMNLALSSRLAGV